MTSLYACMAPKSSSQVRDSALPVRCCRANRVFAYSRHASATRSCIGRRFFIEMDRLYATNMATNKLYRGHWKFIKVIKEAHPV